MPSTHVSLHYHLVFSTKDRVPSITAEVRERVHAYLGGVVRGLNGVGLEVGGTADHVHLLVGLKQEGYGAFTVSASNVAAVRDYVRGQEHHHRKRSFQDEYREFLAKHEIEFDERYLW